MSKYDNFRELLKQKISESIKDFANKHYGSESHEVSCNLHGGRITIQTNVHIQPSDLLGRKNRKMDDKYGMQGLSILCKYEQPPRTHKDFHVDFHAHITFSGNDDFMDDYHDDLMSIIDQKQPLLINAIRKAICDLSEEKTPKDFAEIPQKISKNYKITTLSDVKSWAAKAILRNSGEPAKRGWDTVGYVHINPCTGEMVPIARCDEHHTGYDLIEYLKDHGLIDGNIRDFIGIFIHGSYVYDETDESKELYVRAFKIWRKMGGPNINIERYRSNTSVCVTMDDYIEHGGHFEANNGELFPAGKRFIEQVTEFFSCESPSQELMQSIADQCNVYDKYGSLVTQLLLTAENNDINLYSEVLSDLVAEHINEISDEVKNKASRISGQLVGFYGDVKLARKLLNEINTKRHINRKCEKIIELSEIGKNIISVFERTAIAYRDLIEAQNTTKERRAIKIFFENVSKLLKFETHFPGRLSMDIENSINQGNAWVAANAIFSHGGLKNWIHNELRDSVKNNKRNTMSIVFGNAELGLREFDRISGI